MADRFKWRGGSVGGVALSAGLVIAGLVVAATPAVKPPATPGRTAAAKPAAPQQLAAQSAPAPAVAAAPAADQSSYQATEQWIAPGSSITIPQDNAFEDSTGKEGIYNASGPIQTAGHPFFQPIGTNGRACVTCHQPSDGMSVSLTTIHARWEATGGKDPMFAAIDGSDCPSLPQDKEASHSLLLKRGLFRIGLPWPPRGPDGKPIKPEFKIEVVQDPTGCNTDPVYGLNSPNPTVSVYRRPRPVANMKYVVGPDRGIGGPQLFNPKVIAMPLAVDPETGKRVTMQIMSDARALTLKAQAIDASINHLQVSTPLTPEQLKQIVDFEMQIYAGQSADSRGGDLTEGPKALGPHNLAANPPGVLGDNYDKPVFYDFASWKTPAPGESATQRSFRESVMRGYDIYFSKPFWIRDVEHLNTVGLGNPVKRTCATCHNMQMTGMDLASGWVDLGVQNLPWAEQDLSTPLAAGGPQLPLFKITCDPDVPPHMFLGRVIYTHDPGRALISGRCMDVGAIVMQQFRSLAARAPYFSNGSAKSLRELVDFYDRRFNIGYTDQEKDDLINFLSVL
jgi:cytochrome c peroxidase